MVRLIATLLASLVCFINGASAAHAATVSAGKELFNKGRVRGSGYAGWGRAFDQDYITVSAGLGYHVLNRTELTLDYEAWLANDPKFYKLTPGIRYNLPTISRVTPYIGGFYRRVFYPHLSDADSYGGRAGIHTRTGKSTYTSAGVVVEQQSGCKARGTDCTTVYPEIGVSFAF